jgi:hypothetical protein
MDKMCKINSLYHSLLYVENQINLIDIKDIEKRLDQIEIKDKETYNNFITNFEDIKIKYNKLMNDLSFTFFIRFDLITILIFIIK